jgi:hypothetical protein
MPATNRAAELAMLQLLVTFKITGHDGRLVNS